MSLGIDFDSILASTSMVFGDNIFDDFGDSIFIDFYRKWLSETMGERFLFPHFFDSVPQVVCLKVHWLTLARFWNYFDSILIVLGILFDPFSIF